MIALWQLRKTARRRTRSPLRPGRGRARGAALRSDNRGIEWHTLGGHLADSVPFWVMVGAGIPGGYTQRDPCPHRGAA
jgi:hypothetical protein